MLDINLIREKPDMVKENLARRKDPEKLALVDGLFKKDAEWRDSKYKLQLLQQERNKITREIAAMKKEGKDIKDKVKEMQELPDKVKVEEERVATLKAEID
ncbi:serine--tRNA ligase, partial [Candidatus Woesearchaeota archaeon CG08_land_8_20_14_0_20_43_7]